MVLPAAPLTSDTYLFIDGSGDGMGTFQQNPVSKTLFTLDYSGWLADDETIAGVAFTAIPDTTPQGSALSFSNPSILTLSSIHRAGLSFLVGGGVLGTTYLASVTVTTSLGQVKVDTFNLQVTPSGNGVGIAIPVWPYGFDLLSGPYAGGPGSIVTVPTGEGSFDGDTIPVGLTPTLIVPINAQRRGITLVNTGTADIVIGPDVSVALNNGFLLKVGAGVELDTQAAVFAITASDTGSPQVEYVETMFGSGVTPSTPPATANHFVGATVAVGIATTLIASSRSTRHAITLINSGTADLTVGPDNTVAVGSGTLVRVGAEFTLETTSAVYAISPTASGTPQIEYVETYS